jgi:hypothetical protein
MGKTEKECGPLILGEGVTEAEIEFGAGIRGGSKRADDLAPAPALSEVVKSGLVCEMRGLQPTCHHGERFQQSKNHGAAERIAALEFDTGR